MDLPQPPQGMFRKCIKGNYICYVCCTDFEHKNVIDKLAQFVARNGADF